MRRNIIAVGDYTDRTNRLRKHIKCLEASKIATCTKWVTERVEIALDLDWLDHLLKFSYNTERGLHHSIFNKEAQTF